MNKIMNFFRSPMGKFLLWAVALTVVGIIIWKQYEKSIYGGMTKTALIDSLAAKLSAEAKQSIITTDTNYLAATTDEVRNGILAWYNNGYQTGTITVSDIWLKQQLSSLGIDYNKRPQILLIANEIGKRVNIK